MAPIPFSAGREPEFASVALKRCGSAMEEIHIAYHDHQWGVPVEGAYFFGSAYLLARGVVQPAWKRWLIVVALVLPMLIIFEVGTAHEEFTT